MTKYIIIAGHFAGNIACYYDGNGYLVEFAVNSWNLKQEDHKNLLENMGYFLKDVTLQQYCTQEGMMLRRTRIDLSFERFWIMYGHARNRIPAERLWVKLNEKEQYLVLVNLKAYLRYCKRNIKYTKLYPDTYLRTHTKDDWDKVEDFKK